jgi:hypothetical protein
LVVVGRAADDCAHCCLSLVVSVVVVVVIVVFVSYTVGSFRFKIAMLLLL